MKRLDVFNLLITMFYFGVFMIFLFDELANCYLPYVHVVRFAVRASGDSKR